LHPFQRGRVIEQQLGQNLPGNFPTIDRFQNGVATSSKSMDLAAPTYANAANITSTGRGVIDSVAGFQGRNWAGVNIRPGDITARGLDLAVPAGATQAQQQALQDLVNYGTHCGVNVRIVVVP
jgi:filamentous hemagglutinin